MLVLGAGRSKPKKILVEVDVVVAFVAGLRWECALCWGRSERKSYLPFNDFTKIRPRRVCKLFNKRAEGEHLSQYHNINLTREQVRQGTKKKRRGRTGESEIFKRMGLGGPASKRDLYGFCIGA